MKPYSRTKDEICADVLAWAKRRIVAGDTPSVILWSIRKRMAERPDALNSNHWAHIVWSVEKMG